ncbi:MAG TPA: glycosyltransferase family 4 protein [Chthoniobacter sp.]|jgi:glycosyltransferase involved in cell wall biosynthesis
MKILVVSNLYPPHHLGGYELGCRDVVEKLRERGHEIRVLAGDFRSSNVGDLDDGVMRSLLFRTEGGSGRGRKLAECRGFFRLIREFSPDLVYFWSQAGLSHWLPLVVRLAGLPMAFFLSDTSFVSWRVGAWLGGFANRPGVFASFVRYALGRTVPVRGYPIVKGRTCHFASDFLRTVALKDGIQFSSATSEVIHWGIETGKFAVSDRPRRTHSKLLFVGRLSPAKGLHTALAALALLVVHQGLSDLTLTVVGEGPDRDYSAKIRNLPTQLRIPERVTFVGELPRSELPRIYGEHDILIFPSEWEEPFAITPLEAMASGLVVVGTVTGGSGELFRNRENAMTFAAGDAEDCARAIRELVQDRALFESIASAGKEYVLTNHTLNSMVDHIEASLRSVGHSLEQSDRGQLSGVRE